VVRAFCQLDIFTQGLNDNEAGEMYRTQAHIGRAATKWHKLGSNHLNEPREDAGFCETPPMSQALLETALRLRQAGKLTDAAAIYRQILAGEPGHFEALHALGLVRYQSGQLEEAERLISEAIAIRPNAPDAHYNRACLLMRMNRPGEALSSFDAAIAIRPEYLEALANRGNVLAGLNRHAEALASFDKAVALRPAIAELWISRAGMLFALGRLDDAVTSSDRALALKPAHPDASKLREQIVAMRAARNIRPSLRAFEELVSEGRHREALQNALQILNTIDLGFGRLSGVDTEADEVQFARRFGAALVRLFESGAELSEPEFERLLLYHRWIDVILSVGEIEPSLANASLRARLALRPLNSSTEIDLDAVGQADPRSAATAFLRYTSSPYIFRPSAFALRERLLEWLPERLPEMTLSPLTLSRLADVYMHCSYAITPRKHAIKGALMTALRHALLENGCREVVAGAPSPAEARPTIVVVAENLRVGHSVHRTHSRAIASLRERFHVIGLANPNPQGTPIEALFDECWDMDGSDVLQLAGSLANRILARKPALVFYLGVGMTPLVLALASLRLAPVQCVSFGHTATTMSDAIDYFVLPDDFVASETVFSERVLAVPKDAMPMTPRPFAAVRRARPSDGIIRIAIAGSTMKLNPKLFDALADIVARARTPAEIHFFPLGAVGLAHAALTSAVAERIKNARVNMELSHDAYMEQLGSCDLFLSPFPYGNMNSIIDCFQLGLPGVCLDGPEAHSHADGAFFARIGLPRELVAQSVEDYVAAAVRLIDDGGWRSHCRDIVAQADLDAAFFTGDTRLFSKAIADLL
jgi:predicted O-linked N-acetylglucosamine transferase (SPINDLY family)